MCTFCQMIERKCIRVKQSECSLLKRRERKKVSEGYLLQEKEKEGVEKGEEVCHEKKKQEQFFSFQNLDREVEHFFFYRK